MNRIAKRARIVLIFVAILAFGLLFFVGEFLTKGEQWVMFTGSPHVFQGTKPADGLVLDRDGALLLDLSQGKSYAPNGKLRQAMLHWTGDRQGNVGTPALKHYTREMVGYDIVNGVYTYADNPGRLKLTLSAAVQQTALEAMGDYRGTIGVYNYQTGAILCALSTPTFDPDNVPDLANDPEGKYQGVYLNRFLQSAYTPGSIFKIVTLAAAIESVPDILDHSFSCTGVYEVGNGDITCEEVHGEQTLKETFANSCNCGFAQIVSLVGKENLQRYVTQFGVTNPVTFDGITTVSGNFDITDTYGELLAWSGIGQHTDLINPCRFMTFMGAIASGGTGTEPYVVEQVKVGSKVTYSAKTQKQERILSVATAQLLQQYMRNNVQVKYGANNFPGMTVCAKTGTGEVGGDKRPNASMAGFVLDEQYPFAFVIMVEEGGYGGDICPGIISKVLLACKNMADNQT